MDDKPMDFKGAFKAWVGTVDPGEHPADETLRDYALGRLEPAEKEHVQEHLVHCRSCLDLFRDLRAFSSSAEPSAEAKVANFEAAAFWRTLQSRLEESEPEVAKPAAVASRTLPRRARGWQIPALLAACLAFVALGVTSLQQGKTIAELRNPRANVDIHDLYLDTSERSGVGPVAEKVLSPAAGLILFTPRDPGEYEDYRVTILDDGGGEVWSDHGFVADPDDGSFTLWLPPGFLAPGDYAVRLFGIGSSGAETIEEYGLRIKR